jgi:branched-chain amino acid transport system permease protein
MQELLNGLVQGSVYALAAVGLSLIFGVVRVPHFAHGESVMVGAMVTLITVADHGVPLPLGMALGVIAATVLGVAIGVGVFQPLKKYAEVNLLIASLALVLIIEAAAAKIWGQTPRVVPGGLDTTIRIAGGRVTEMRIVIFAVAVVIFLALHQWVRRSRAGRAMRAMALNMPAARLMGIPTARYSALVFAVGSAMAGLAGALLGTILPVQSSMGSAIALKSFVIVIFAGMGSIGGALAGGLLLGLVEAFGGSYLSSGYVNTYAFLFLVAVLLLRPQGLFALGAARD